MYTFCYRISPNFRKINADGTNDARTMWTVATAICKYELCLHMLLQLSNFLNCKYNIYNA